MSNSLRIIFAGTPNFAAHHLNALIQTNQQVIGVLTQPNWPADRSNRLHYSPVRQLAEQYGLPVFQSTLLHQADRIKSLADLGVDIIVVVAYGTILPQAMLDLPRFGCINVHGSLLPRWRGAAPVQRALCAGDNYTGITIIKMDAGLDTGAVLHKVVCTIQPHDTSASLYDKLAKIGSTALLSTLTQIRAGLAIAQPQDNTFATYANKLSKEEARLDWRLSAVQLERNIRAFNPWPISYFFLLKQSFKVWSATVNNEQSSSHMPGTVLTADKTGIQVATGKGILTITHLQRASKRVMLVKDLLNSCRKWFIPGTILE